MLSTAVAALLVVASCSAPPTTPSAATAGTAAPSGADATASPAGPSTGPADRSAPSSGSLIAAAEQAGTIDHDTALVDQLMAALDYASLPAAYQSANPAEADATTILAELTGRLGKLAPDLAAKVAPLLPAPR